MIEEVKFSYDVLGNRVEKDVDANGDGVFESITKFAYDLNGNAWADLTSGGSLTTRRIYEDAVDKLFARIGASNNPAFYLADLLGSVRDIVNGSGSLIDNLSYDSYGTVTTETSPSNGDRYAWTSRERDSEINLQYNRARYYDPATGRWISQDPLGFDAGDGNLYRYVSNSPAARTDPSGKWTVLFQGSDPSRRMFNKHLKNDAYNFCDKQYAPDFFHLEGIKTAVDDIIKRVGPPGKDQKEAIVLIGHSSGGSAAVLCAWSLGAKGYKVDLLVTLDPVAYSQIPGHLIGLSLMGLPKTVKSAINIRQDAAGGFMEPKGAVVLGAKEYLNKKDANGKILGHDDLGTNRGLAQKIQQMSTDVEESFAEARERAKKESKK